MPDPLSIAGSAVGIISLGIQVCQGLVSYYQSVKDQSKDISTTTKSLERLSKTLEHFQATIKLHRFAQHQSRMITDIEHLIYACEDAVDELDQELTKFTAPGSGVRHMIKKTARQAIYPFKEGTLMKLRENILDIVENLELATNILQLDTTSSVLEQVHETSNVLSLVKLDQVSNSIRQWLNAPDTFGQHYDACAKRHKDTGLWFVRGPSFESWLANKSTFLWLNGFAGSGKTVLASTIIQETLARRQSCTTTFGIAYFYLSYADTSKQSSTGLLKSLLLQLSCLSSSSDVLSELHTNYSSGGAPQYALLQALEATVKSFEDVYIVIDALDESPKGEHRDLVCRTVNEMRKWPNLHLLATSRGEADIRESLSLSSQQELSIQNDEVVADIRKFIKEALREDSKLVKWKAYYDEIESALIQGAGGMFRWVDCQFLALRSCLTANMLRTTLKSLPTTLDATYDRMLGSIAPEFKEFGKRLLTLLCFSASPLKVCELIEALAITVEHERGFFDLGDKMSGMHDLLTICPGMIRVQETNYLRPSPSVQERDLDFSDRAILRRKKNTDSRIVSLAHFSVREYLVSDRVLKSSHEFHLQPDLCHAWIAKACLVYISMPDLRLPVLDEFRADWCIGTFDFFDYALKYWADHGIRSEQESSLVPLVGDIIISGSIQLALLRLVLGENHDTYPKLYRLCVDLVTKPISKQDRISIAIKWLAYEGIATVLKTVVDSLGEFFKSDPTFYRPALEERCSLHPENAVNIAIRRGHWRVVDLLLQNHFKLTRGSSSVNNLDPLQIAARNGIATTVTLILSEGQGLGPKAYPPSNENPNNQHPILLAAWNGHVDTVKALMDAGVSGCIEGRHGITPLIVAARRGHVQLVKYLVDQTTQDIDLRHKRLEEAELQAEWQNFVEWTEWHLAEGRRRARKREKVITMSAFLDHQTDYGSTALMRAAECGHLEVVKILVQANAHITGIKDSDDNDAFLLAVKNNRLDIVQYLSIYGVDTTLRNDNGETPKEVARRLGFDKMAEYLQSHRPTAIATNSSSQEARKSPTQQIGRTPPRMPWHSRVISSSNNDEVPDTY